MLKLFKNFRKSNVGKTTFWIVGNTLFGCWPLIIMWCLEHGDASQQATTEVKHLFNDGLVLFLACSMMGAIVIDILNDGISLKGSMYFALTIFPFFIVGILLIKYILKVYGVFPDEKTFGFQSKVNIILLVFSFLYCCVAKYFLYKDGGLKKNE